MRQERFCSECPTPRSNSLVATLSISLTVPLSILADMLWKEKRYGPLFFAGAVPMFCSYFIVALLTHFEDWDPLLDVLRFVTCGEADRSSGAKCSFFFLSFCQSGQIRSKQSKQTW